MVDAARLPSLGAAAIFMQGTKKMPGTAVTKSVVANEPGGRKREEIFVDIIEKISVTFSSSGYILTSEIDGTIQMKSYLTGNPEIRLALNEDLSIGRGGRSIYDYTSSAGGGSVMLDDCNFHESVHLDSFDIDRTLNLVPPDGEFTVMNYRMTQEFRPPFRINALIEEAGPLKAEVILKIRADFSSTITANTVFVQMPVPAYTTRVSFELEPGAVGNTTDFKEANKRLEWGLKKDCWWIRAYSTCKAHIFTGITCKYHKGSWTSKHDLHHTNVQCFQASGKIPADSKEIQDLQPISMGKICDTGKFICCSYMIC
uniref:MHD domain-containing protein n=1 Tax=Nelumbo nucifera TaxID=4432 RepID=A0A822ZBV7_NELNU|nr:TPA_asm: hypothetical protein HUJ06_015282 [Nelumbo nucifera]